jgi:hypothetical protein
MTWKDKLEIGLKEDAPYRRDNLPDDQVQGSETPGEDGRSPEVPEAREDENDPPVQPGAEPAAPARRKRGRPKE